MKKFRNKNFKCGFLPLLISGLILLGAFTSFAASPLYTFDYQGSTIETYAYSSVVDGVETSGFRYFVKDGNLVVISNQLNSVPDGIFIHYEDGESYIAVLTRGGKLVSLGTVALTSKLENFKNSGITSLASNVTDDTTTIVVGYNTGAFVGYDCITGKEEFRYGAVTKKSSFLEYVEEYVNGIIKKTGSADTSEAKKEAEEIVNLMNAEGYSLDDLINAGVFADEDSLNDFVSNGTLNSGGNGTGTNESETGGGGTDEGGNQEETSAQSGNGSDGSDQDNGSTNTEDSTEEPSESVSENGQTESETAEGTDVLEASVIDIDDLPGESESESESLSEEEESKAAGKKTGKTGTKKGTEGEKESESESASLEETEEAADEKKTGNSSSAGKGQGKGTGETGTAKDGGAGNKENGTGLETDGTEKGGTIGVRTGDARENGTSQSNSTGESSASGSSEEKDQGATGKDSGKEDTEEKDGNSSEKESGEPEETKENKGKVTKAAGEQYVTVYNPETGSYEIYSVSELMENPEDPKSENSKLDNKDNKAIAELLKVREDEAEERGIGLYAVIIAAVVGLMVAAVFGISRLSKNEAEKDRELMSASGEKEDSDGK